jgi:biotin synthase
MCYAIPGKITEIQGNTVTVDYYGEKKKARNEFFNLKAGDYIYAQGGFVVQKIAEKEASAVLETWQEVFQELKLRDKNTINKKGLIFERANRLRKETLGNSCCVHGIIEFSNYCMNDCLYCGIRKSNTNLSRYRLTTEQIIEITKDSVHRLGFKSLVLQSGVDMWYTEDKLIEIVTKIRNDFGVLLILSIGERDISTYKKLYDAGARGILMRFETSNEGLYEKYKPGSKLRDRLNLIRELGKMGYLVFTGFLAGLPGETEKDVLENIKLTGSLSPEMFSFGPFIPHPDTPLGSTKSPSPEKIYTIISETRLAFPESKIVVTTALETLDSVNGTRAGLLSGANSVMINVTPVEYRRLYELYPNRAFLEIKTEDRIKSILLLLNELGRAPVDIGI